MPKILDPIMRAEKGSDLYHLTEEIARRNSLDNPGRSDNENWFDAQDKLNNYLLEEKIAENFSLKNSEKTYEECIEEARTRINNSGFDYSEEIIKDGISIEKIVECNLKYFSNYYYTLRKRTQNSLSKNLEKAFEDWKRALSCVAYNISKY